MILWYYHRAWVPCALGPFPFSKNSGLKFRKLHVLNGTVHSDCTDPTQVTARRLKTQSYTLKEKSKYCLYPKQHSTVENGRWKTKGGGVLFRVESHTFASEGKKILVN